MLALHQSNRLNYSAGRTRAIGKPRGDQQREGRTGARPLRKVGRVDGHGEIASTQERLSERKGAERRRRGRALVVEVSLRLRGWNERLSPPSCSKISFRNNFGDAFCRISVSFSTFRLN